jgi:hypothetical protein
MVSTSNVIYLRQYKTRKKFNYLKKILFSKDTLFILFAALLITGAGILSFYASLYFPLLTDDYMQHYNFLI